MTISWGFELLVGPSDYWSTPISNYDSISEVYQGINAVKLFGWERMYLDPKLQELNMQNQRLPWYAPAIRLAWFIIDIIVSASLAFTLFILFYVHTQSLALTGSALTSAYVLKLRSHVFNLGIGIESIILWLKYGRSQLGKIVTIQRALRGRPVHTLPRRRIASDKSSSEVVLDGCSFAWSQHSHDQALTDVTLRASGGELVAVVGKTGAGKSSLLLSICGELEMTAGTGGVTGTIAYLEQSPWIMNDTMRANVLFGREYDAEFFARVIHACALVEDIAMWPNADLTVIGERGINISGGQRARLALARTLYSRADIYVLDDPLSAVDAHVKRHILEHVLLDTGMLAGKLRIIATNSGHILPYANQVVTLTDGHAEVTTQSPQEYRAVGASEASVERPKAMPQDRVGSTEAKPVDKPDKVARSPWANAVYAIQLCGWPTFAALVLSAAIRPTVNYVLEGVGLDMLKNTGAMLSHSNALRYLGLRTLQKLLVRTLKISERHIRAHVSGKGINPAIKGKFIQSIIHAPMPFFDSTTRQHVSSAYNDGAKALAEEIPKFVMEELRNVVESALSIHRIGCSAPQLLLAAPVVAWAMLKRNELVDPTVNMLRRINRETGIGRARTTDIVADGKQMIRLFNVGPHFVQRYIRDEDETRKIQVPIIALKRLHDSLDSALRSGSSAAVAWLLLLQSQTRRTRISPGEFTTYGNLFQSLVYNISHFSRRHSTITRFSDNIELYRQYASIEPEAPYVVDECRPAPSWPQAGKIKFCDYTLRYREDLDPALKGINLTIEPGEKIGIVGRTGAGKSTLVKSLFRLVHGTTAGQILVDGQDIAEMGVGDLRPRLGIIPQESTMFSGSFKRNLDPLQEYTTKDMWAALVKSGIAPKVAPPGAPTDGVSGDDNYDEIYEEAMAESNNQWATSGWPTRLLMLGLYKRPKRRTNKLLQPWHGLDRVAQSGSQGFSAGEQQLFSLCRVLMRMRRIIVLDEATADVDLETDRHMQQVFRDAFAECTVLTIAHRLETIMASDRIVVMDKGRIAEIGTPQELIDAGGLFAELVKANDFGS
ncbi:Multidrug resistance-associated protein 1 [Coemansia helicoidea]|uniref:Multidrug resistance-associated protein 1 n=1 Tax=Coemansia helicoidea TaxID=1286919 RepID=A0ACC1LCK3_9FUNG|nr:Multidrug resistance-associated protein 1 [Coemansia helicoidea]